MVLHTCPNCATEFETAGHPDPSRLTGKYILLDWSSAGLDKTSATSGQIDAVERSIIGARIGHISDRDMAGIADALKEIFGLAD